jgi:hypothetical protein
MNEEACIKETVPNPTRTASKNWFTFKIGEAQY